MWKATFIILFSFLIFITIINGKPFYRPMPGLMHRTLNKILTKKINERFNTESTTPLNKILTKQRKPIVILNFSGFQLLTQLTESRKFKGTQSTPEPTLNQKTSPIGTMTKQSKIDLPTTKSTKSEIKSRKHPNTGVKSEKLSVPQARYKLQKHKIFKKCHLQFFEKCNFEEWSRFLNSGRFRVL